MVKIRGRNGWFKFASHECWMGSENFGYVELFSCSPFAKQAPVQFAGPAPELVRLLRLLARELEAEHRAQKALNKPKKVRKK